MGMFDWFRKRNAPADARGTLGLKREIIALAPRRKDLIVLEAGASGGEDTFEWAALPEIKKVLAFEPEPKSFKALTDGARKFGSGIECIELGLSRVGGVHELYVSENENAPDNLAVSSSLHKPGGHLEFHPGIKFNTSTKITTVNLDEWAETNKVSKIDIAWLDMQGAEFDVLDSAPKTLSGIDVLYTEVSLMEMYENTPLYPEFRKWLESKGFVVKAEHLPWKDMGNVLFVRK
jgi:FkbM family methyltransferase